MELIRTGIINTVNPSTGMVTVMYPDRGNEVSDEFPVFSFTGEYRFLKKGEQVLILKLSNGGKAGIVLGRIWDDDSNVPPGADFYKEMARASICVKSGSMIFSDESGSISLDEIISGIRR
ncbi:MAG: hypothetical protein Q4F24_08140 [Eubacteriales bacterium]|nr:hypothetical protein [Eubacteriales bacterium]